MREQKIKVWDKVAKHWLSDELMNQMVIIVNGALFVPTNYEMVLGTGLSDKNGVELYSGDRVKSFDKWVFQICFGKFQSHMSGELHVGFFLKTLDDRTYPLSEARDYEKIGNIHSDPLEEKDDH